LGDSKVHAPDELAHRLTATEWLGAILPAGDGAAGFTADFPLGGLVSACLAAAEPFKFSMRRLLAAVAPGHGYRELEAVRRATLSLGTGAIPQGTIDLGDIDFVSGGAITNAALNALLRVPGI